jgi:hypothetical protein
LEIFGGFHGLLFKWVHVHEVGYVICHDGGVLGKCIFGYVGSYGLLVIMTKRDVDLNM